MLKHLCFILLAILLLPFFSIPLHAALVGNTNQATLNVNPATGTFNANDTFAVSIYVNTNNQNAVGVSAYFTYDKTHFEATSIDTTGSVFTIEWEKIIDSANGKIKISRTIPTPGVNTSNGLVAKINFKALSSVTPVADNLTFDFTPGVNTNSQVIKDDQLGTNILSGTYNGRYTISGGTADTTAPTVTAFIIPSATSSLTVSITSFTASDDVGVTGYLITESATVPSASAAGWSSTKPTSYTFSSAGAKTLYAWAKDAAGNVSTSKSATVTITLIDTTAPVRSNGSPTGTLSVGITQTTLSLFTNKNATCKYSTAANTVYSSISNTFSTTGGTSHSTSILGLQDGQSYSYKVRCQDLLGNANSDDFTVSFSVASQNDTTSPTISSVSASSITSSGATIAWATDEAADSQVEYGLTETYGSQTALDSSIVISHSQSISGLSANTTYHFRVKSKDASNNQSVSSDSIFTTQAAQITITNGSLARAESDQKVYLIENNQKRWIPTAEIFNANGYSWSSIQIASPSVLAQYAEGQPVASVLYPNGSILKSPTSDKIYIIVNGQKRWITSPNVFAVHRLPVNSQKIVSQSDLDKYPTGHDLSVPTIADGALIRAKGDIDVYIVKYNRGKEYKRLILSPSVFNNYGHLKWQDIRETDQSVVDSFATADLVRAVNDTKVYKLYPQGDTGQKRWIKTADAFTRNNFDWDAIYEINKFDRDSYLEGQSLE